MRESKMTTQFSELGSIMKTRNVTFVGWKQNIKQEFLWRRRDKFGQFVTWQLGTSHRTASFCNKPVYIIVNEVTTLVGYLYELITRERIFS